jgi:type II secretion system protein I
MDLASGRGLTLVETLVALALLSVMALAVLPAFTSHADTNTRCEARADAVTLAQRQLEALRGRALSTMPASAATESATVAAGGRSYEVETHFCLDDQFCPPASPGSRHLTVEVYYQGQRLYDAATVYTELD